MWQKKFLNNRRREKQKEKKRIREGRGGEGWAENSDKGSERRTRIEKSIYKY
jgi:hypothetical protein